MSRVLIGSDRNFFLHGACKLVENRRKIRVLGLKLLRKNRTFGAHCPFYNDYKKYCFLLLSVSFLDPCLCSYCTPVCSFRPSEIRVHVHPPEQVGTKLKLS
jgi:hypothetical protein